MEVIHLHHRLSSITLLTSVICDFSRPCGEAPGLSIYITDEVKPSFEWPVFESSGFQNFTAKTQWTQRTAKKRADALLF
jgi:hypothetical protein